MCAASSAEARTQPRERDVDVTPFDDFAHALPRLHIVELSEFVARLTLHASDNELSRYRVGSV